MKIEVKKTANNWCVFINGIEYAKCDVKSVAVAISKTARRDFNRHGMAAFDAKFN